MNRIDVEAEARVVLGLADSPSEAPPLESLARAVLGPHAVQTVPPSALPSDACLVRVLGERRIVLRTGLDPVRRRFAIAHELGHHVLGLDSSSRENEELCDAFAAALVAPGDTFRRAVATLGLDLPALARLFGSTESLVALRLGEVTGAPVALVAPGRVRIRGVDYGWPPAAELRRKRLPGVTKVRLRDDARRLALRVS